MKYLKLFESYYSEEQRFDNKIIREVAKFYYDKTGVEYIASGAFGDAFLLSKDNAKVLKITTDSDEALNADVLRKLNIKGIVEYYDVREIFVNGQEIGYAILMEKIEKPKNEEKEAFLILKDYILSDDGSTGLNLDYKKFFGSEKYKKFLFYNPPEKIEDFITAINSGKAALGEFFETYYIEDSYSSYRNKKSFIESTVNRKFNPDLLRKYYFFYLDVIKDFMKYKISLTDFHSGNLGIKNGMPIAIDVGCDQFRGNNKLTLRPIEIKIEEESEE